MSDSDDCPDLITGEDVAPVIRPPPVVSTVQRDAKVPVCILTGFLGSGKSTLLRGLLSNNANLKVAVVMNEFGSTAEVEKALGLASGGVQEDTWLSLDNGCMCCASKGAAIVAIEKLLAERPEIDRVVVETSGLADPGPVAKMFWVDEVLGSSVELDSVITTVDALNAKRYFGRTVAEKQPAQPTASQAQRSEQSEPASTALGGDATAAGDAGGTVYEAARQVMYADVVVLTKTDVTPPDHISDVEATIQLLNPFAPRIRVVKGQVTDDVAKALLTAGEVGGVKAGGAARATAAAEVCRRLKSDSGAGAVRGSVKAHAGAGGGVGVGGGGDGAGGGGGVDAANTGATSRSAADDAAAAGFVAVAVTEYGTFSDGTALHRFLNKLMGPQRLRSQPLLVTSETEAQAAAAADGQDMSIPTDGLGVTFRLKATVWVEDLEGLDPVNMSDVGRIPSVAVGGEGGGEGGRRAHLVAVQGIFGNWDCTLLPAGAATLKPAECHLVLIGRSAEEAAASRALRDAMVPL